MIIYYTVPDIWLVTDVIVTFHFGLFFCHFSSVTAQKMRISKKWKKTMTGDITILHECTKNHDHMLYCSWDIVHDGSNCYFWIWVIFCPFTPVTARKMKIKKKNIWRYHRLHKCPKDHDHMLYCSWDMAHDTCNCFFHFGLFFALLPLTAQKIKISRKWKKYQEISSFYTCVPKIMIRWRTVPETWCATDRRMDGREKWHIEVGAPP